MSVRPGSCRSTPGSGDPGALPHTGRGQPGRACATVRYVTYPAGRRHHMMTPPRPSGKLDRSLDRSEVREALLAQTFWYVDMKQPAAGNMITDVLAAFYAQDDVTSIYEFTGIWLEG